MCPLPIQRLSIKIQDQLMSGSGPGTAMYRRKTTPLEIVFLRASQAMKPLYTITATPILDSRATTIIKKMKGIGAEF